MKQRETTNTKTKPKTQERLRAREKYQYVTTSPRRYGAASTRDERRLARAMDSLHVQQNKRQTKPSSQIYETKVLRWKLREDETNQASSIAKPEDILLATAEEVNEEMKNKNGEVLRTPTRGQQKRKLSSTTSTEKGLDHTGVRSVIRPMASGPTSTNINPSLKSRSKDGKFWEFDGTNGSKNIKARTSKDFYKANGHVKYAMNDLPIVKKEFRLGKSFTHKSYNLMNSKKSMGKRGRSPGGDVKQTNQSGNDLLAIFDSREKILPVKNHAGRTHIQTDGRPHSRYVVKTSDNISIKQGRDLTSEEEGAAVSDQEAEANKERPNVTEENWAETLKSCRYLRKPRGYETPEVSIESIFQLD